MRTIPATLSCLLIFGCPAPAPDGDTSPDAGSEASRPDAAQGADDQDAGAGGQSPDGGAGGQSPDAGEAISIEAALDRFVDGICGAVDRCTNTAHGALAIHSWLNNGIADPIYHLLTDADLCREQLLADGYLQALIAADRVSVDTRKVDACVASLQDECTWQKRMVPDFSDGWQQLINPIQWRWHMMNTMTYFDDPTPCREFIQPRLPVADACGSHLECETGWCRTEVEAWETPRPVLRGHCGTCDFLRGEGSACNEDEECIFGTHCRRTDNGRFCLRPPWPVPTGERCSSGVRGSDSACANLNDLCIDGICTTVTLAGLGEPCSSIENEQTPILCRDGAMCVNGTCQKETVGDWQSCEGESGERNALCGVEGQCSYRGGTCDLFGDVGDHCPSYRSCKTGLYCDADFECAERQAEGATCADSKECLSKACVDSVCGPEINKHCN